MFEVAKSAFFVNKERPFFEKGSLGLLSVILGPSLGHKLSQLTATVGLLRSLVGHDRFLIGVDRHWGLRISHIVDRHCSESTA